MYLRNKTMKPKKMYNTDLVLQAACAAQRFNGEYLKEDQTKYQKKQF